MRILSIHADRIWYRATKKTSIGEPVTEREGEMSECVVLFCCVEKLDEEEPRSVIASAKENIQKRLAALKVTRVMIYPYAHLTHSLSSPACALAVLKGLEESLMEGGIEVARAPFGWYKEFMIHAKGHPLADLSMTICPCREYGNDVHCPHCNGPPGPHEHEITGINDLTGTSGTCDTRGIPEGIFR